MMDDNCMWCLNNDAPSPDEQFRNKNCQATFDQLRETWGNGQQVALMEGAVEPAGFDFAAAGIGAGVGFVAGYALMKVFRSQKKDDEFNRV